MAKPSMSRLPLILASSCSYRAPTASERTFSSESFLRLIRRHERSAGEYRLYLLSSSLKLPV